MMSYVTYFLRRVEPSLSCVSNGQLAARSFSFFKRPSPQTVLSFDLRLPSSTVYARQSNTNQNRETQLCYLALLKPLPHNAPAHIFYYIFHWAGIPYLGCPFSYEILFLWSNFEQLQCGWGFIHHAGHILWFLDLPQPPPLPRQCWWCTASHHMGCKSST